ncbi:zinc-dependent metalloprotease, partial [bacterium]|nr:zinc-dependent metalloprotease [bacterium]
MKKLGITIFILLFFIISCSDSAAPLSKEETISGDEIKKEEPQQSKGASVSGLNERNGNIVISKDQINKDFLFYISVIDYSAFDDPMFRPTTSSLIPKIVYFKEEQNKLYMFENMEGLQISEPYEAVKVLAEFLILSENEDEVEFDFKGGFEKLIIPDYDFFNDVNYDNQIWTISSYLSDFEKPGELFFFNQVAQFELYENVNTVTLNYAFEPYKEGLTFVSKQYIEDSRFRFFKNAPLVERGSGKRIDYIKYWDISKTLTFSISSNTPSEYVEAVKGGVLAWNKVFNSEVIKVDMAPDGVIAGEPRYNVVQWVEWDNAPGAYANIQSNPKTGEIFHAHVIMPTQFVVEAKTLARVSVGSLGIEELASVLNAEIGMFVKPISIAGFEFAEDHSNNDRSVDIFDLSEQLSSKDVEPKIAADRIVQERLKAVVMHEMGHVLGLRHNFAGSLESKIDNDKTFDELTAIMTGERNDASPLPSSSIMDYLPLLHEALMHSPGEYDRMAIRWAYYNESFPSETPKFCTDDDVMIIADCMKNDVGSNPIAVSEDTIVNSIAILGNSIVSEGTAEFIEEIVTDVIKSKLLQLTRYVDNNFYVWDLNGEPSIDRSKHAMNIIEKYLGSMDGDMSALKNYMSPTLASYLSTADTETFNNVMLEVGDAYLNTVVHYLGFLNYENGISRYGQKYQFHNNDEIARSMANILLGYIVNSVGDVESIPFVIREKSAELILNQ